MKYPRQVTLPIAIIVTIVGSEHTFASPRANDLRAQVILARSQQGEELANLGSIHFMPQVAHRVLEHETSARTGVELWREAVPSLAQVALAQYYVGRAGSHQRTRNRARRWVTRAFISLIVESELGNPFGLQSLGEFLRSSYWSSVENFGVSTTAIELAMRVALPLAEDGDPFAGIILAQAAAAVPLERLPQTYQQDWRTRVLSRLLGLAKTGDATAMFRLAQLLPETHPKRRTITRREWLKRAFPPLLAKAKHGDIAAAYLVGTALLHGLGVDRDSKAGLSWLQRAAADSPRLLRRREAHVEARSAALGPADPAVWIVEQLLSRDLEAAGRLMDAEAYLRDALSAARSWRNPKGQALGESLNNLANNLMAQGHLNEAEPYLLEALSILGDLPAPIDELPGHPSYLGALVNLGVLYGRGGRLSEAEEVLEDALSRMNTRLIRKYLPLLVGPALASLASVKYHLGWTYEAEVNLVDAVEVYRRAYGVNDPIYIETLANYADLLFLNGHHSQAAELFAEALAALQERSDIPPATRHIVRTRYAALLNSLGRWEAAERLLDRAIQDVIETDGPESTNAAGANWVMADLQRNLGKLERALTYYRKATNVYRQRLVHHTFTQSGLGFSEREGIRELFVGHAIVAAELAKRDASRRHDLLNEAFEVVQLTDATAAGRAIDQFAGRAAAGDSNRYEIVRRYQDTRARLADVERELLTIAKLADRRPYLRRRSALRQSRQELLRNLEFLDAAIDATYPEYRDLISPTPLSAATVQSLLRPEEALVVFNVHLRESLATVVRKNKLDLLEIGVGSDQLSATVAELRSSLDPLQADWSDDVLYFDAAAAHSLYEILVAPLERYIDEVKHIFLVLDGPLESLPFSVLLRKPPDADHFSTYDEFQRADWLAKRYAISVLPSVSSLRALRGYAASVRAPDPFLGIGDPLLKDHPGVDAPIPEAKDRVRAIPAIALKNVVRGTNVNLNALRNIPSLPETATELLALALATGAGREALVLRDRATERIVRQELRLDRYRILAFATHAVTADLAEGPNEPALILTPPEGDRASAENDGLLTASEIAAAIKLNADWVILSACNTAASDGTPGAEGLSGLAKAFFYAGARALFVSHWPVVSESTVKLTTAMLKELKNDPKIGRAEAHRRAMLTLMNDESAPMFAHPLYWAPFIVVGEGGRLD